MSSIWFSAPDDYRGFRISAPNDCSVGSCLGFGKVFPQRFPVVGFPSFGEMFRLSQRKTFVIKDDLVLIPVRRNQTHDQ